MSKEEDFYTNIGLFSNGTEQNLFFDFKYAVNVNFNWEISVFNLFTFITNNLTMSPSLSSISLSLSGSR